jgi:hypothetical protein
MPEVGRVEVRVMVVVVRVVAAVVIWVVRVVVRTTKRKLAEEVQRCHRLRLVSMEEEEGWMRSIYPRFYICLRLQFP